MSIRPKKDPPAPKSADWASYRPDDDLYWRLGGPFVPIDQIPPQEYTYLPVATHMKSASRIAYLSELIEQAEKDLERSTRYYLELEARGIDAMESAYYRDQDRKLEAEDDQWRMVARNVDRHRASAYRSIRMGLNKLAAYRAQLVALEAEGLPLFFGRS